MNVFLTISLALALGCTGRGFEVSQSINPLSIRSKDMVLERGQRRAVLTGNYIFSVAGRSTLIVSTLVGLRSHRHQSPYSVERYDDVVGRHQQSRALALSGARTIQLDSGTYRLRARAPMSIRCEGVCSSCSWGETQEEFWSYENWMVGESQSLTASVVPGALRAEVAAIPGAISVRPMYDIESTYSYRVYDLDGGRSLVVRGGEVAAELRDGHVLRCSEPYQTSPMGVSSIGAFRINLWELEPVQMGCELDGERQGCADCARSLGELMCQTRTDVDAAWPALQMSTASWWSRTGNWNGRRLRLIAYGHLESPNGSLYDMQSGQKLCDVRQGDLVDCVAPGVSP